MRICTYKLKIIISFALLGSWQSTAWISPAALSKVNTNKARKVTTTSTVLCAEQNATLSESGNIKTSIITVPIFDFKKKETLEWIDRLDDAVMGGISTSQVQPGDGYARWGGICRTDGGGFCGFRTNPFDKQQPLMVGDSDGFYVQCRLTSDNEPERRVWKMTTRCKPDRGELLYQAPFPFTENNNNNNNDWTTVYVPFDTFRYVRGPRMVPDAPPMNTTNGLYQIGMTMSKFAFNVNTTELEDFRDGFFELQIKEIGLYKKQESTRNNQQSIKGFTPPKIFTKEESKTKRPLPIKILQPIAKIFFSEQSQRRKSAMRILREERKLSRGQAILWGLRSRAKSIGIIRSISQTLSILAIDCFRTVLATILRLVIIYPIRLLRRLMNVIAFVVTGKKKSALPSLSE